LKNTTTLIPRAADEPFVFGGLNVDGALDLLTAYAKIGVSAIKNSILRVTKTLSKNGSGSKSK
jgi:hypothetical protein